MTASISVGVTDSFGIQWSEIERQACVYYTSVIIFQHIAPFVGILDNSDSKWLRSRDFFDMKILGHQKDCYHQSFVFAFQRSSASHLFPLDVCSFIQILPHTICTDALGLTGI